MVDTIRYGYDGDRQSLKHLPLACTRQLVTKWWLMPEKTLHRDWFFFFFNKVLQVVLVYFLAFFETVLERNLWKNISHIGRKRDIGRIWPPLSRECPCSFEHMLMDFHTATSCTGDFCLTVFHFCCKQLKNICQCCAGNLNIKDEKNSHWTLQTLSS